MNTLRGRDLNDDAVDDNDSIIMCIEMYHECV
jgi:hypothetical protein